MSDAQDSLSSTVSGNRDEVTVLCGPRRVWNDKINNLLDMTKKAKTTSSVLLSLEPSNSLSNTLKGSVSTSTQPSTTCERSPFATYEECELFSCGQNNYGELCLGHCNSTSKLEHVSFFSGKSVKQIAGGNEVLAVVMKDGAIYTCGLNKSGQCGNGTFEERVLLAMPVRALNGVNIEMVAAANGCEHMLAISSDGSVYSWGYNDRGQLGLGSTISKSHTPRLIESLREKHVVTYAAVSYHHSAVVTSAGEVLTFGMNDCGQLGLDHNQHQHTPQLVDALTSQVISRVACGLYHTVVATVSGEVYTFGKNDYGQLGLGHARNVKVPNLVKISIGDSDEKVVDVCCGYYHTVAITEKGKLITWGRNDYGQLGIGSKDHKSTPQYVPLPLSSKIKRSSCGCYHTLILLSNGRVMVFGRNNKGQLGAGARTLPSADLPLPIPSNSLSNDDVVAIAAGFYSSYILTGRTLQNGEADALKEDGANGIDLPEHHAYVNSDALYESLMREIDRMNASSNNSKIVTNNFQLQPKRTNIQKKLPLIKLHAAAWAMTRALMYQALYECFENVSTSNVISVSSAGAPVPMKLTPKVVVNPVLRLFIDFLIDNLKQIKLNGDNNNNSNHVQKSSKRGNMNLSYNDADQCGSLQNACIGLLKHFASRFSFPGVPSLGPKKKQHLYSTIVTKFYGYY
jgi:RCC1 and BTB domain-containing protein